MKLSARVLRVKESPTFVVMGKAAQMKKNGLDVIVLAAGEPDFDTPQDIKDAAIDAINKGKTRYTAASGTLELRQAIVNKFSRENNLTFQTDEIIVSAGGKHSLYNVFQAIINDGDEVIIPAPYWVSYPDMVLLANGTPVFVNSYITDNFKMSAKKLQQAITPKTRAVILNSPNNPTGMAYSVHELRELAEVLIQHPNICIITDDLYEHLSFSNDKFVNIANIMPELLSRTIVINGVSKAYSMTGWRIGYAACTDKSVIKAMDIIQSQSTSNPCSIAQYAAEAALNGGLTCVEPMRQSFIKRHEFAVSRINDINGLSCIKAQGAFYVFISCIDAIEILFKQNKINEKNDIAFSDYVLENCLVAVVPGSAFGLEHHVRISFATSIEELTKAFDRIEKLLGKKV